jgi:flagellar assembly protein FliH
MANSSDWLGALAEPPGAPPPGWLALLGEPSGFREMLAFGEALPEAPPPAPGPAPVPEPEAQPDPAEEALARAYAEGEAAGRAAAEADAAALAARQRSLRLAFRSLDETAAQVLADDLAATVLALCEAVLGECTADRAGLLARCHVAARRIGGAADALILHLHPDDIHLLGDDVVAGWQVTPDPTLERGSVLIEGADGVVSDGPAEWRRAIAAAVRG